MGSRDRHAATPDSRLMSQLPDFASLRFRDPGTDFSLDLSRMGFTRAQLDQMQTDFQPVFEAMRELEAGAIANPSEGRRVGHYWLRAPKLAPDPALRREIQEALDEVLDFAAQVREGRVTSESGAPFRRLLLVGIGGSALGPQLLASALPAGKGALRAHFFDNTDPEGMADVLREIGSDLPQTLVLVISKSGGTKETRNGMLEARDALEARGLDFAKQAVAVTGVGSELYDLAQQEHWLATLPMWDWVGGRTSLFSAVGLLPSALQGHELAALRAGAAAMDRHTRSDRLNKNLAALLAATWYLATDGAGHKDMVVLPYRDRLLLFSRYLQQLVMESLGKERDLDGKLVYQGLTVYGNKGATDQHAYVQQLREGVPNFFVAFVRVLEDGQASDLLVEGPHGSADFLHGFLLGTRTALTQKGRPNLTLTLPRLEAFELGALIALFERAVGFYASLVHINAYDQPGVEAGKHAADQVLALRARILSTLDSTPTDFATLLSRLGPKTNPETTLLLLEHLSANTPRTGVTHKDAHWSKS